MATDYERPPETRAPRYDASSAGYVIGVGVVLAIIVMLYITLT
jgi:hypothetical protein